MLAGRSVHTALLGARLWPARSVATPGRCRAAARRGCAVPAWGHRRSASPWAQSRGTLRGQGDSNSGPLSGSPSLPWPPQSLTQPLEVVRDGTASSATNTRSLEMRSPPPSARRLPGVGGVQQPRQQTDFGAIWTPASDHGALF